MTSLAEPVYKPVTIGPSWQRDDDGKFVLPVLTLGWQVLGWTADWLQHGDGRPWRYTDEQARLTLWWYAIDETGRFLYREGVIQRLKGWGKDPLVATWCAVEFVGPCRFSHFDSDGDPVAKPHPEAWVQVAAVSKDQTRNTFTLFPQIFSKRAIKQYRIDLGKEIIYADHGAQRIEAVTSSPRALEGGRPTFVVKNETHHWLQNNEGHEMDAVIDRNSTKSADGAARIIGITNAYEPAEDSTAQRTREAWEEAEAVGVGSGIMYDSLEAPPEAPLTLDAAPAVIEAVRGDSYWLDIPRIVASIADRRNPPSRSRRFWYNQVVAAEDSWIDPRDFDLCQAPPDVAPLGPKDEVVLFADMSKSDDATGVVACRLSDGLVSVLGMWQRPPGLRGADWITPRHAVDAVVDSAFDTYKVVAFWGDPSHVLDDETQERYWDGLFDDWHRRFGHKLELWAEGGTHRGHSIMWDMSSPQRTAQFTGAAERCALEIGEHTLLHDGDGRLRAHARNAKRYPNRYGVSLWKGHRESKRKIDLAVCMVGARMVRRLVLNNPDKKRLRSGKVW